MYKKLGFVTVLSLYPFVVVPANLLIGFEVPKNLQKEVETLQTTINKKTKWSLDTKNYQSSSSQISLVYIGEIDDKRVDDYKKVMQDVALTGNPFELQDNYNKSKLAYFGLEKEFLGLELPEHVELTALVYNLKTALKRQGLSFDKRWDTYRPHITLGVIKSKGDAFFKNLSFKPTQIKEFEVNKIFLSVRDAKNKEVKSYFDLEGVSMARIIKRLSGIEEVLKSLIDRVEMIEKKTIGNLDSLKDAKKSSVKA